MYITTPKEKWSESLFYIFFLRHKTTTFLALGEEKLITFLEATEKKKYLHFQSC